MGPGPSTIQFANLRVAVPNPVRLTRGWTDISSAANPVSAQPPAGGGLIGLGMAASKAGTSVWDFSKLEILAPELQPGQSPDRSGSGFLPVS